MARNQKLSFGLVTIEASVDKATESPDKDVRLESASPDGNPVQQQYIDAVTGEVVSRDALRKGIFLSEVDFREVPQEKLEEITELTKGDGTLDLTFEPVAQHRLEYATNLHFVKPRKGYEAKLALMAAAMEAEDMVAVTTYIPTSRQSLAVLFVRDGVLYLAQLPFHGQRKEIPAAARLDLDAVDAKQLKLARQLVKAAKGNVSETATDEAIALKAEAIDAVVQGAELPKAKKTAKAEAKTDDLEGLLAASLEAVAA